MMDDVVTLSRTAKKGKEQKSAYIEFVKSCLDDFKSVWLFSYQNVRNNALNAVRVHFREDGRLFLGKNNLLKIAFGLSEDEEHKPQLHLFSEMMVGNVVVLMTNTKRAAVSKFLESFHPLDFAKSGHVASETIVQRAGLLPELAHSLEPELKALGMPVKLDRGTIRLESDFTLCSAGQPISTEQAKLLKHFGHKISEFHLTPLARWKKGRFKSLVPGYVPRIIPVREPKISVHRPELLDDFGPDALDDDDSPMEIDENDENEEFEEE